MLAGTAVTLCALPIARREAQRKSSDLAHRIANQVESSVAETTGKTRTAIRKLGENVTAHKEAVVTSVNAAKDAYRNAVETSTAAAQANT